MSPISKPNPEENKKDFMKFYSLAFELVVMNVGLILGGYYLDRYLHSSPAMILIGVFMSMSGTIWLLLRALK